MQAPFAAPEVRTVTSSNIQLNGIPDKLIICVRKVVANLGCHQTDSYATIKGISINFNNQAGLLSSMTPEQLFRNSVQSGLANMCWDEFCGSMISCCGSRPVANQTTAVTRSPYSGMGSNVAGGGTIQASNMCQPRVPSWCSTSGRSSSSRRSSTLRAL
jgi:hypothetical protein